AVSADDALKQWHAKEIQALKLLKVVGQLRFDNSVELIFFRREIYDVRPSELIALHKVALNYIDHPIFIEDSLALANALLKLKSIQPARIDLGKLNVEWTTEKDQFENIQSFIDAKIGNLNVERESIQPKDVVLYGFGRIGRLLTRRIIGLTGRGEQLRLKAIVLRPKLADRTEEMEKRASLLRQDTVHGRFPGSIEVDGEFLVINGNRVAMIFANDPSQVPYELYNIKDALLIDNTGVWRDKDALSQHLKNESISKVLLTAPGKDIPNIVQGVNTDAVDFEVQQIFSAASCTTNAIVPVIQLIDSKFGIAKGHIETIHAYTSDQNLLDNFHKKPRRGKGAATNMVLTTTGAAKAVAKVLPHLKGKLTGNAVRVPTPNVSLAIINLTLDKPTEREEVNAFLKHASLHGQLVEQLHISTSTEYVSSNAVGMTSTSVIDAPSTIVSEDGKSLTVYAWYDNEYGYTCQVVRLSKHIAGVRRQRYY
ncbi:MAG: glyceraldehyde-3-phosphate dehydrogenase, partial [Bacteroidota bacterium]